MIRKQYLSKLDSAHQDLTVTNLNVSLEKILNFNKFLFNSLIIKIVSNY